MKTKVTLSSSDIANQKNYFVVLSEGLNQGINDNTGEAGKKKAFVLIKEIKNFD